VDDLFQIKRTPWGYRACIELTSHSSYCRDVPDKASARALLACAKRHLALRQGPVRPLLDEWRAGLICRLRGSPRDFRGAARTRRI